MSAPESEPTTPATPFPPESVDEHDPDRPRALLEEALVEVKRVIAGQDEMLERVLVCLVAGGHLLIEGVPGLAKTLTIKTTAAVLGGSFRRIQFTPDLVPSDLVGTRVYRPDQGASRPTSGRSSATSSSPTRSTARPPRCSRRCSR
ncbi:MAG: AAA family ATPase [Gaiella sp.]|nr:AAA family ATPase [Gaiella sp.]